MRNIKIACSNEYAQYLKVTIASILKNASKLDTYEFFVLDGGLSNETKLSLEKLKKIKNFSLTFKSVEKKDFNNFHSTGYYIPVLYYKFLLPELIKNADKIIYLDCDIIVTKDIAQLWDISMNDHYIAAVEDIFPAVANGIYSRKKGYVNTGMLLINSKKWRLTNLTNKLLKYSLSNKLMWMDQDAINDIVPARKILHLNFCWNVQATYFYQDSIYNRHSLKSQILSARKKPFIVHYLGHKPWENSFVPMGYLWFKYKSYVSFYLNNSISKTLIDLSFAFFLYIFPYIRKYFINFYRTDRGINIQLFHFLKTKVFPLPEQKQ